ncbi:hypothetical protein CSKR_102715 [Clonorchis sinensis]|uniref:Uncharacterized protein n=1 Tax=Clonorchis sinensis TaxID=79923 RepID=A0A3R7GDX3_CLOSI|nr:hypothetical protein CSKR_102715 [Clonorchis sinensis]
MYGKQPMISPLRQNNAYFIRDPSHLHADLQCAHYNQVKPFPPHHSEVKTLPSSYLPPVSHNIEITTHDKTLYLSTKNSTLDEPPRAPDRKQWSACASL